MNEGLLLIVTSIWCVGLLIVYMLNGIHNKLHDIYRDFYLAFKQGD
jgi:hypothetical protein